MTREELRQKIFGLIRMAFDAGVSHAKRNTAADLGLLSSMADGHVELFLEAEAKRAGEAPRHG